MFVSQDQSPFRTSGSVNVSDTLHPSHSSQRRFISLVRPFGARGRTIASRPKQGFGQTSHFCHEISPEDGSLIEPAQKACWPFSYPQVAQTAIYMKRVEIVFHRWTHVSPSLMSASLLVTACACQRPIMQ
jgi:hypothetical protein